MGLCVYKQFNPNIEKLHFGVSAKKFDINRVHLLSFFNIMHDWKKDVDNPL